MLPSQRKKEWTIFTDANPPAEAVFWISMFLGSQANGSL
jgi:hypothetical protein